MENQKYHIFPRILDPEGRTQLVIRASEQRENSGSPVSYEPGVCNIGRNERSKRFRYGVISIVTAGAYLIVIWYLRLPAVYALVSGIFVYSGVLNFIQYRRGFCVSFAVLGQYDFTGSGGDRDAVRRGPYRQRDRRRAYEIGGYALGISIVATLIVYLVYSLAI